MGRDWGEGLICTSYPEVNAFSVLIAKDLIEKVVYSYTQ